MLYKKGLLLCTLFFLGALQNDAFSQTGVISSNMQSSFNALTVPQNTLELEPTFSYSRSLGFFDSDGEYKDISGAQINSSLYFRATYGVSKNLEIGAGLSTNLRSLNLGSKLHLLGNDSFGLALLGGINSDITTGTRPLSSLKRQYVLGLASHFLFSETVSLNASFQYQDQIDYEGYDYFINSELGYYFNKSVLGIVGFGYQQFSNSNLAQSTLFSLYPGFAIERKRVIIVVQGQFDLLGENKASATGISVSLNQILD